VIACGIMQLGLESCSHWQGDQDGLWLELS